MRADNELPKPSALDGVLLPRVSRIFASLALVVAALWVAMSMTYPFGWDQGIFAWAGDVIVRGGLPYADAWDMKGPFVYYVYALTQTIFGTHLWSIRVFDAALLGAATISLARAAEGLTDRSTARWAALGFFLWYAAHSFWHTAQPDAWAAMLLIIALAPAVANGTTPLTAPRLAFAGSLIGLATLGKPLYVVFLLLPFADALYSERRAWLSRVAAIAAGWLTPIVIAVAWFAWRGALADLVEIHIRYAALYAGLSPGGRLRGLVDYVISGRVVAVAIPVCVYGGLMLRATNRRAALLLLGWIALAFAVVVAQNRFYDYHWLPMLPPITLLTAFGLHVLGKRARAMGAITAAVLFMHALAPVALEEARYLAWLSGRMSTDAYYDAYGEPGDDMKAIAWLKREPPGSVYVFGWNAAVPWLSGRETVSRFGFSMPLLIGPGLDVRSQYRSELMNALQHQPPRFVVLGTQAPRIIGTEMTLDDVPELASWVRRDYRERVRIGALTILERAQP